MVVRATVVSHSDSPFRTEALFSPRAGGVTETSKSVSQNYPQPHKAASPDVMTLFIYSFSAPNSSFNTYSAIMDRIH